MDKVDYWICDLDNYGYEDEELARVIADVNGVLGDEYFDDGGASIPHKKAPSEETIDKAVKLLNNELNEIRSSRVYVDLLQAYQNGDQEGLVRLVLRVFPSVTECHSRFSKVLYHGISIHDGINASDYVDIAVRILENGLSASPHGRHHSMDENVRPIYNVIDPEETHGILFFKLEPGANGYTVFNPHFESERLVYAPTLEIPMELFLKSGRYFGRNLRIENGSNGNGEKFRDEVERNLRQRGIDFKLSEPTGFQDRYGTQGPDCC